MSLTEPIARRRTPGDTDRSALDPPVRPGEVIAGKYRVDGLLGAGGMGVVVGAFHLQLEQHIAIKFMSSLLRFSSVGVRRFMREAQAAARIHCEHVVRVFDVAELPDGTPYIVMEYLDGGDLEQLLHERGRLPVPEAVEYVLQACEAIAEAHVGGIVHRDLKPGNLAICRRADGSPLVKVLDFGVSKLLPKEGITPPEAWSRVILGSPLYVSPEQIRSPRNVDARADIWALGAILYELVSGGPPFGGETLSEICANILHAPLRPLHPTLDGVPGALDDVLARCLEKRVEQRFQTVADLAEALGPFAPEGARLSVERITRVIRGRPKTFPPHSSLTSSLRRLRAGLARTLVSPIAGNDRARRAPRAALDSIVPHSVVRRRRSRAAAGWWVAVVLVSATLIVATNALRERGAPSSRISPAEVPSPAPPHAAPAGTLSVAPEVVEPSVDRANQPPPPAPAESASSAKRPAEEPVPARAKPPAVHPPKTKRAPPMPSSERDPWGFGGLE